MKKTDRKNSNRSSKGYILGLIENLNTNDSFFTECSTTEIFIYASRYGKKVKTEKLLSVCPKKLETKNLIKVTIL